jgi:MFS family permease
MSEPASASEQTTVTAHHDAEHRHGLIAARIDRLPLGTTQFMLAAIMQITWGLVVALDLVFARIYPFIWGPKGEISSFQFDLLLVFNTGIGILIGEYGLGLIADKFGRRPVLILSALFAGGFIWEIAFSNSFWPLLAWNTLYAIGVGGALSVVNTYMHEIAPVSRRGQLALRTQLIALVLSAVIGSVPAFFWIPQHYQWVLFLDAALPLVIVIPLVVIFVPESPRWLAAKGRFDQADKTVKKWEHKASRTGELAQPRAVEATVTRKVPTRELFTGTYGRRTILLATVWILAYGGMIYGQGSYLSLFLVMTDHFTAHQLFAQGLVSGLVGAGVFLVFSNIGERVERKTIIVAGCVVYLIGGCLLAVTQGVTAPFIFAVIMQLGEYIFFMNLYSYTALSYPTRLRSAGTGWTDGIGHCGSALSPLVAGPLFTATVASMNYGWFIWILLPGTFIPGLLILIFGKKQSGRALELLAE